jgi:hypothetical protein
LLAPNNVVALNKKAACSQQTSCSQQKGCSQLTLNNVVALNAKVALSNAVALDKQVALFNVVAHLHKKIACSQHKNSSILPTLGFGGFGVGSRPIYMCFRQFLRFVFECVYLLTSISLP